MAAAVAVLLAGACAGNEPTVGGSGANVGSVVGAHRTTGTTSVPLRTGLLRVDEIRPIVAFGFDTREQPVLDPKQFALTTLRGPCGATVKTPFRADGGFKVFRSTVTLVVESVAEPGEAEASAFLDALQADAKAGCPAFEEQLGGGPSSVATTSMLTLPPLGDEQLGWAQTVTAPDGGRVGHRYLTVVRGGPRVLLLAVLATQDVDPAALNQLTTLAAAG